MRTSFAKIVVIVSLTVALFLSICPPSFAAVRRVQECGVESYVSKADPVCGVASYSLAHSPKCGVEKYNQKKSKDCPGYISGETVVYNPNTCPAGYQFVENKRVPRACSSESNNHLFNCYDLMAVCTRAEVVRTCRLDKFGVESYNACRDPANGIESYQTCARPEFGVATFNECEIRKTEAELVAYIQNIDPNIDVMGASLLRNAASLLQLDGNETALACYIKRWDSDPLYSDVIGDLKAQFPALFGVAYDPSSYDCSGQQTLSLPTDTCSDTTPRCKFQTAYKASLDFLESNKAEVAALMDDVVARSNGTYKTQLESLNAKIDNYFKS